MIKIDMDAKFKLIIVRLLMVMIISLFWYPPDVHGKSSTEKSGDLLMVAIPVAGYGAALLLDDRDGRVQFHKSFLLNLGVTYSLKAVIDKQRPDGSGEDSFPSGHTSVSFHGASFIQTRYGWRYGIPAFAAASYVAWSRVNADRHDGVDVLAGAAIGVISSRLFTQPRTDVTVTLFALNGHYGMAIMNAW